MFWSVGGEMVGVVTSTRPVTEPAVPQRDFACTSVRSTLSLGTAPFRVYYQLLHPASRAF